MKKTKTWNREEIIKIISESLDETHNIIKKQYPDLDETKEEVEDKDLFDVLGMLKDELLLVAFAECIKSRLK